MFNPSDGPKDLKENQMDTNTNEQTTEQVQPEPKPTEGPGRLKRAWYYSRYLVGRASNTVTGIVVGKPGQEYQTLAAFVKQLEEDADLAQTEQVRTLKTMLTRQERRRKQKRVLVTCCAAGFVGGFAYAVATGKGAAVAGVGAAGMA